MDKQERIRLRRQLLKRLRESFVYSDERTIVLTSGRKSHFYIDSKKVTLDPEGAYLVGRLILDRVSNLELDAIGGTTLGADPIVTAVSILSYGEERSIPAFIIRKDPKPFADSSSASAYIEGNLRRGASVVVVDDVLTGGRATERSLDILKEAGCKIVMIIALVDRKEGGREYLEDRGYRIESLFTVEDLLKA